MCRFSISFFLFVFLLRTNENPTFYTPFWFRQYLDISCAYFCFGRLHPTRDPRVTTHFFDLFLYQTQMHWATGAHFAFRNCDKINSRCAIDYYYYCCCYCIHNETRGHSPIHSRWQRHKCTENILVCFIFSGWRQTPPAPSTIAVQRTRNINILIDIRIRNVN